MARSVALKRDAKQLVGVWGNSKKISIDKYKDLGQDKEEKEGMLNMKNEDKIKEVHDKYSK